MTLMSVSRSSLIAFTACLLGWMAPTSAVADIKRPNIIMIMADDMGVENLSCYGASAHKTPHLDALAAGGIRFNHAHSQPICTPSRVQIMTGIYNNRNYVKFGLLDPEAVTFGNVLRDAGYTTAIAGKWQLLGGYEGVRNFGFDHHCLWQLNRRPSRYPNPGLEIDGRQQDFKNGEFGPDIVSDYVCDFLEKQKDSDQPFFIYYPMIMPHWPFVPTPDHPDWDPEMWKDAVGEPGGYKGPEYWDAFVSYTDKMVGQLVAKLEETGLRDDTLVMWTGDNGTYTGLKTQFKGKAYPGGKGSPKDNGTHVGFIASWPNVIKPGQTSDSLVDLSDVFPTLMDVSGTKAPKGLDGVSLLPVFKGQEEKRQKEAIYCYYSRGGERNKATQHARDQRYKLYATGKFHDTRTDLLEETDLAANGVPEELKAVHAKLKKILDHHLAITKASDPIINAKRGKKQAKPNKAKAAQKAKKNKKSNKDS